MKYLRRAGVCVLAYCLSLPVAWSLSALGVPDWARILLLSLLCFGFLAADDWFRGRANPKLSRFKKAGPTGVPALILTCGNIKAYQARLQHWHPAQFEDKVGPFATALMTVKRSTDRTFVTRAVLGALLAAASHPELADGAEVFVRLPKEEPFTKGEQLHVVAVKGTTDGSVLHVQWSDSPTWWMVSFALLLGRAGKWDAYATKRDKGAAS